MRLDPITLIHESVSRKLCQVDAFKNPACKQLQTGIVNSMKLISSINWSSWLDKTRSWWQKVMPDDHSEVVPLLPIPNRTVKRLCADDSADSRVKVGHRQAIKSKHASSVEGAFFSELQQEIWKKRKTFSTWRNSCYNSRLRWSQPSKTSKANRKVCEASQKSLKIYSR